MSTLPSLPLPVPLTCLQLCKNSFDVQAALQELVKTPRAKQTIEMKCWSADEAVSHWGRAERGRGEGGRGVGERGRGGEDSCSIVVVRS